jgi:glycosyltransferase involved in cell wall biosynthesis
MRIAIDGFPLSEPLTGIGHYTLELAHHLALNSPEDEFLVVSPKSFVPSIDAENGTANLRFSRVIVSPLTRQWWSLGLPRYIRKNQIQLFHGTNFEVPLRTDCPTVITIHDLSTLLYPQTHKGRIVRRARRRLPLMARTATMIITDTETIRQEINEHLQIPLARIVTVSGAARSCFRRLEFDQTADTRKRLGIGDEFLLYVGTIEPRKNLLTLVRAFEAVLSRRESHLQLVIAGRKGWMVDDLFAYVNRSPASSSIIFTGYLSDDQLAALYSSCTLFVYPSLYEGFGLPPLEAMACGAPVIASRIPSMAEVLGSAAKLIAPERVTELSEAIVQLLDDASLRQRLSLAGKKCVADFSWDQAARSVRDVYQHARNVSLRKGNL